MSASMVSMSEREKREIKSQLSSTIMENSKRHKTTLPQLYVSHSFNIFLSILFVTYTIFSYFTLMREADFGVRQSWTFSDILMDHPKKNFRLIPIIVLHATWFLIATFFIVKVLYKFTAIRGVDTKFVGIMLCRYYQLWIIRVNL